MILLALTLMAAEPMASDRSRYAACLALAKSEPGRAIETAHAWRIENGGVGALHCLALAQFERKEYTAAFGSFEAAAKASQVTGDGQAVILLSQGADAALLAGQPDVALRFLGEAIGGAGTSVSPRVEAALRVTRAEALVDLKRDKEAATDLDRAVTRTPDSAEVQYEAGNIAAAKRDMALAKTAWAAAAAADPESMAGLAAAKALAAATVAP